MKILHILSESCTLKDCPVGIFTDSTKSIFCVKTEYTRELGDPECYLLNSGETYWGGVNTPQERSNLLVYPCIFEDSSEHISKYRRCKGSYYFQGKFIEFSEGYFHGFFSDCEEFDSGPGNYTQALVELPNGLIVSCIPTNIQFLDTLNI